MSHARGCGLRFHVRDVFVAAAADFIDFHRARAQLQSHPGRTDFAADQPDVLAGLRIGARGCAFAVRLAEQGHRYSQRARRRRCVAANQTDAEILELAREAVCEQCNLF
jgi:hypothetical protein